MNEIKDFEYQFWIKKNTTERDSAVYPQYHSMLH